MAKYIDIESINWYDDLFMKGWNHSWVWVRYRDVENLIRKAPAADVRPVVRGKWESTGSDVWKCSVCGYGIMPWNAGVNYCPNCAADMREVTTDG